MYVKRAIHTLVELCMYIETNLIRKNVLLGLTTVEVCGGQYMRYCTKSMKITKSVGICGQEWH